MLNTESNQKHLLLGKYISIHDIHQGNIYFLKLIQASVSAQTTTTTLKLRKKKNTLFWNLLEQLKKNPAK